MSVPENWIISAEPDPQMVNPEWEAVNQPEISGVAIKHVRHVVTNNGFLTEVFRTDWGLPGERVDQVFTRHLEAGSVSAWHCHAVTTDRLFCVAGRLLIVLYDGRNDSPTSRRTFQVRTGLERPCLVVVPCGVWHGVKNIGTQPAILLNAVDEAYSYTAPDHWRIGRHDPQIPFDFDSVG